jgi:hypothetical protein
MDDQRTGKPKLGLVAVISVLVGLTGTLAYGVSSGCSYCGVALPGLWGVAILVIGWGLTRPSKETQICIKNQGTCDHEFVYDEYEEVLRWHGDTPIWCIVKVNRCWKCAYLENEDVN